MFAASVTFKLLALYVAFKYGDAGHGRRPWILGLMLAIIFAFFDLSFSSWTSHDKIILGISYLVSATIIMQIYYRTHGILTSMLVVAIGTAVLFFGVPYVLGAGLH